MSMPRSIFSRLALFALPVACLGIVSQASAGTWSVQKDNLATILMGVDFLDLNNGYLAGGNNGVGPVIFRTSDGGRTFTQQIDGMPSATYLDVSFGDASHAIAGGLGMFYRFAGASYTADGRTWKASQDRWLASAYQDVEAVDAQTMFMMGMWARATTTNEGVAVSQDGGRTFTYFPWGIDTSPRYGSFLSPQVGYVAGGQWPYDDTARFGKGNFRLNRNVSLPINTGLKTTEYDGYRGVIAKTVNGGESWELLYDDLGRFYFNQVQFVDEFNGWALAEGDEGAWVLHTSDGGITWEEQSFQTGGALTAISMIDDQEGWVAGASIGLGFEALFLHTVDGGQTWEKYPTNMKYYIMNMDFVDRDHGWAVAMNAGSSCSLLKFAP